MKVRIQAVVDGSSKPIFDFAGPTITIGRDAGCELPMAGTANVSGRHAQITLTPDGASLIDLESTNGTFLNDRRIEGRKKLHKGDYFRLGQTGPCFQIVELDLTGAAPISAVVGTVRERPTTPPAAQAREPEYAAPAPMAAPVAKSKPKPMPHAPEPAPPSKPAPAAASGQTRLMVVELQKKNRSLMIGVGAAVLALVVIGGAIGLYLIWKQRDLSSKTATLDDTAKKLQENADDLKESVGKVATNVEKLSKNEEETIFNRYADAVFRVEIESEKKGWVTNGTAFAFDKNGKLATNAHVSRPAAQALRAGRKVTLFSHGGKKMYAVIAAVSHSEYIQWANGIEYQTPDVGVLTIGLPAGEYLPKVVELASETELRKLSPGVYLCYIGFPGWSDYDSLTKIEPHLNRGGLTRLVTLKEESGNFANQFLLQHDISSTGGASGSPIFNRDGKVVGIHNSGQSVPVEIAGSKGKAIQSIPFGTKAGMRIDLLQGPMK